MGIISAFLIWLLPAAIGHDIEVVWEKGLYDEHGGGVYGFDMGAGDVDGDGYIDLAVSWGQYNIIDGWRGGVHFFSTRPLDTFPDIMVWTHDDVGAAPNIAVLDINGDGTDDLVTGNQSSKVWVYFGPLVDSQKVDAWMSDADLGTMGMGCSIANAGDVNTDGYEDLIAGACYSRYGEVLGAAYIFFGGPDFGPGYHDPDVVLAGEGGAFGWQVEGGADFNADGFDDVIVGANQVAGMRGRVYIYFGGDPMDTLPDLTFTGEAGGNQLAYDEIDLLTTLSSAYAVFGSQYWPGDGKYQGKAYVLFGGKEYDNVPDVEITGRTDSSFLVQGGCYSTFDADHDGRDDFAIGAPAEYRQVGSEWWKGATYFYRGGDVIDNVYDGWLEGQVDELVGFRLAPAGDVDGDGRSEFMVSNYPAGTLTKVWLCKFTGVGIEEGSESQKELQLRFSATVTRNAVRFYYDKPLNEEGTLSIYDVTGALVRRYEDIKVQDIVWDLRDDLGRRVSSGAYTVRLTTDDAAATQRVIVVK